MAILCERYADRHSLGAWYSHRKKVSYTLQHGTYISQPKNRIDFRVMAPGKTLQLSHLKRH